MEVPFTPEQEAAIAEMATTSGKNPSQFVRDTMGRILRDHERFVEGVKRGIDAADRGDLIEHEDVVARIEQRFRG